jgi:hypothetical protein
VETEESQLKPAQTLNTRSYLKNQKNWDVSQEVEQVPTKNKALIPIPSTKIKLNKVVTIRKKSELHLSYGYKG